MKPVDAFSDHLRSLGPSPKTVSTYALAVARALSSLGNPVEVTPVDLAEWRRRSSKAKPSTVNLEIGAVRAFFRWAAEAGIVPADPSVKLRLVHQEASLPPGGSQEMSSRHTPPTAPHVLPRAGRQGQRPPRPGGAPRQAHDRFRPPQGRDDGALHASGRGRTLRGGREDRVVLRRALTVAVSDSLPRLKKTGGWPITSRAQMTLGLVTMVVVVMVIQARWESGSVPNRRGGGALRPESGGGPLREAVPPDRGGEGVHGPA